MRNGFCTGFGSVLGTVGIIGGLLGLTSCGSGLKRLQALEVNEGTGYGMYRSSQPEADDVDRLCRMGVRYFFALNGHGYEYANALKEKCPEAKIVYDVAQDPSVPVSSQFLSEFDQAIAAAKAEGSKILFHCSCGCHRTGRLAAYYRMKYQGWSADQAIDEMLFIGRDMDAHPYLNGQVHALSDFIQGTSCRQTQNYCVSP